MTTPLYLASDHAGFDLKCRIVTYLANHDDYAVTDLGTHSAESVHYPEYGFRVARAVADDAAAFGIIICGSGIGISIAANRVSGARAALCHNAAIAELAREHNNANILALGARFLDDKTAFACVDTFLTTPFAGGRHATRVALLDT